MIPPPAPPLPPQEDTKWYVTNTARNRQGSPYKYL